MGLPLPAPSRLQVLYLIGLVALVGSLAIYLLPRSAPSQPSTPTPAVVQQQMPVDIFSPALPVGWPTLIPSPTAESPR